MSKRSLPTKPRLRACFDVIFMEDKRCQIRSGEDLIIMLQGRTVSELFPRLLRDLNGDLSLSELAERYRAEIEFDDMISIITQLNDEGILEDASCKSSTLTNDDLERYRSQMTFFSHFVPNRFASQEKLAGATVAVVGFRLRPCRRLRLARQDGRWRLAQSGDGGSGHAAQPRRA